MNYHDASLNSRTYKTGLTPLNIYCARSACNVIMPEGTPAQIYDGATMTHIVCPAWRRRDFAAHKQPDTGMVLTR